MCTITFVPVDQNRWLLGMNRDERKDRAQAKPPEIQQHHDGTEYLAPIDSEAGGTWAGVNEHGIVLLLINNYQAMNPELAHRSDALSRGLVIPQLMNHTSIEHVIYSLKHLEANRYNPFTLFIFSQHEQRISSYSWDGVAVKFEDLPVDSFVKISSGFDPEEAYKIRNNEFRRRLSETDINKVDADWVKSLHQSTYPEPGALSIAMLQEKVMSVSAIVLEISPAHCSVHYGDGWPGGEIEWLKNEISFSRSKA